MLQAEQQTPMTAVQRERAFFAANGPYRVRREDGSWLFETGALLTKIQHGTREHVDPPSENPLRLLELRMEFCRTRASAAEATFNELRGQLLGNRPAIQFSWNDEAFGLLPQEQSSDEPNGYRALLKLKQIRRDELAALKLLQDEFDQLPFVKAEKQRKELRRIIDEQHENFRRKQREMVQQIRLDDPEESQA